MKYKKTTIKNGLRIITVPMKDTQTATVVVMVGVGSRYESEKQAGLSHFIEHMFFKGTHKRPTTLSIGEELDAIGGEYNAFTGKDRTLYYVKVDSKHLKVALDVVSDIYLNSILDEKEIEKEKGTILQELNMYEDNPMASVGDVYEKLMYTENSLGREIIGYKKTISSFRRQEFFDYMRLFYVANDTAVCIAGKFDEKSIIRQVENYFEKMPHGPKPKYAKVKDVQKSPKVKVKFKKTDQTHLILGVRAFHENHKDRYVLGLLSIILGGNMSSRLFIEVREKQGLAYYVRSAVGAFEDCGYLATQAGVDHKNLSVTIKTILKEYKKIATEKVSQKELQKAKDYIKGHSVMGFEASDEVAMFYIDQETRRKKIMSLEEVFKKFDKVTPADILRVAKIIFKVKNLNLAVIGPQNNNLKICNTLKF